MTNIKVTCISDTHNKHDLLDIEETDLLIHAGDFTTRGRENELTDFIKWFAAQPAKYKIATPGNHDWITEKNPDYCKKRFEDLGCHLLIDEILNIQIKNRTIKVFGSPWSPHFHSWAWNFPKFKKQYKKKAKSVYSLIEPGTDIIISHGPPYMIRDQVDYPYPGEDPHVGCKYLRYRTKKIKPQLLVCGHIHEAFGTEKLDNTTVINAASCNLRYHIQQDPISLYI